jgi:hypothetical protein
VVDEPVGAVSKKREPRSDVVGTLNGAAILRLAIDVLLAATTSGQRSA